MTSQANITTRRAVIASLATGAAAAMIAVPAFAADHPDAAILQAWSNRQNALSEIEQHDSFWTYHGRFNDMFDEAETAVHELPAHTPAGVLAKLWVALSHMGGVKTTPEQRAEWDTIRRADMAGVEAFAEDFDFDCSTTFHAIQCLTKIVEGR